MSPPRRTTLEVSAVGERPQRSDGAMFDGAPTTLDAPSLERDVRALWERERVFERTLDRPAPRGPWVFYEGPPTANGRPGVHHVLSRAFKDVFPRFKTMQGHRVTRKGGWDTHGLPVEIAVEQELGFTSKQQIEDYGIAAFNQRCRDTVFAHIQDWNDLTERIAFWVDLESAYVTYHNGYIESCWWVMKSLWDRGLLEEDYRTTWHSPSSNTTLASHEVSLGYRDDVPDPSVYPAFPADVPDLARRGLIATDETRPVAYVAWTTTPWTLAANTGLAVHPEARYVVVEGRRRRDDPASEPALFVLAEALVGAVFGESPHRIVSSCRGVDLVDARYHPILRGRLDDEAGTGAASKAGWRVVADDFVTLDDGTGIVHLAPAYGDLEVGRRHGLPTAWSVDLTGRVMPEVRPIDAPGGAHEGAPDGAPDGGAGPYAGVWFKAADASITHDLIERGAMFADGEIRHTYPFNWRDGTPLMNVVKKSWYVRTSRFREQLLRANDAINWYPDHIRTGRFGKWLEGNVDWALSRERYWGAPLPIWRGDDGSLLCVGSVAELSELAGRDLGDLDLHRPAVDEVVFEVGGVTYRREPYTVDVWFESGAMPYAQWHYTGQDGPAADALRSHFPADYICEAIDQTRGWFYSLLAESTLLFDTSSYRTVLCLGHIVDEHGKKMSKSAGNILDPWELIDRHGADPLRWLMFAEGNPWQNRRVGHHLLEDVVRSFLLTLWNTHVFFTTYARIDGFTLDQAAPDVADRPAADRWVLAELAALVDTVDEALEGYDVSTATRALEQFVDDLSNWYVRRNRRRFWKSAAEDPSDKAAAYRTLHTCLVTLTGLLAPFVPFVADRLWRDLMLSQDADAPASVHLTDFPRAEDAWRDEELRAAMGTARRVVELGRQARNDAAVRVRQPLARALVSVPRAERDGLVALLDDIAEELNVKELELSDGTGELIDRTLKPNFRALGPAFQKRAPEVAEAIRALPPEQAEAVADALADGPARLELDGEQVELTAEMVEVVESPRTGWAVASDGGTSFALDTELTRPLQVEGAARELIRAVNDRRKAADLALDERITLTVAVAPAALDEELAAGGWYDVLAREVLAEQVLREAAAEGAAVDLAGLGEATVVVQP